MQNVLRVKKVLHLIGIGGIGMSAIAEVLHKLGHVVHGSDVCESKNTERLRKLDIKIHIGYDISHISSADIIVYSSAIKPDNIELVTAQNRKKLVIHRTDIIAELAKDRYTIAVSGSSGKTTTTAMIESILRHSGIDATVIIGGILNSYKSNAKLGKSNIFLVEADESDKTMLKIPSDIAVLTSVNDDHIDYYGTFDNIKHSFSQFINQADFAVLPSSTEVKCASKCLTFGFENSDVTATNITQCNNNIKFDVILSNSETKYNIENIVLSNAVGLHKVSNALSAIAVALALDIDSKNIRKGLLEFSGIERRFSTIAEINGVKIIEDYAHHPDEIRATLEAARSISNGKIVGILEIHSVFRIYHFLDKFVRVLAMFDYVILTPIRNKSGELIPGCSTRDIEKSLVDGGFDNIQAMCDFSLILNFIKGYTRSNDIVLFMGAGNNISRLAEKIVLHMEKVGI